MATMHVISADAHTEIYIYRCGNCKVILGPAGRTLRAWPAGKNGPTKANSLPFQLCRCVGILKSEYRTTKSSSNGV